VTSRKLEFARGEIIDDKYEVVEPLETSPLGNSYRVKSRQNGQFLRLTMLNPSIAGREQKSEILQAFRRAKGIVHNALLRGLDLGDNHGVAYYVTEDFDGRPLRDLMNEYKVAGRQFSLREAAQISIQIMDALQTLHDHGVVIRALRPEWIRVKLRYTGPKNQNVVAQVKVIGASFWDLVPSGALAEDEFTRGEEQYLAPELKSFDPIATPRADIYSAGVVFYEMLTGTTPVGTFQLPRQRRPDLPGHIDTVVELAIANAPEDRYLTARDFAADIKRTFQAENLAESESNSALSPLTFGVGLALVAAVALVLFKGQTDPMEAALAADQQLRNEVLSTHPTVSAAERTEIMKDHPPNMVYIPAGPYISGRMNVEMDVTHGEPLAQRREVDAFLIDIFEYPNLRSAPPKTDVTYAEAENLCQAAGKRLCSATEWEKACKGPENFIYGYDDSFDIDRCAGLEGTHRSGAREDCRNGWSVFDMSGNFREWTNTPPESSARRRLVRGGKVNNPEKGTRCAFDTDISTGYTDATISFRCCRDADAPPWTPPDAEAPAE